jgi:hypothetical protein
LKHDFYNFAIQWGQNLFFVKFLIFPSHSEDVEQTIHVD